MSAKQLKTALDARAIPRSGVGAAQKRRLLAAMDAERAGLEPIDWSQDVLFPWEMSP